MASLNAREAQGSHLLFGCSTLGLLVCSGLLSCRKMNFHVFLAFYSHRLSALGETSRQNDAAITMFGCSDGISEVMLHAWFPPHIRGWKFSQIVDSPCSKNWSPAPTRCQNAEALPNSLDLAPVCSETLDVAALHLKLDSEKKKLLFCQPSHLARIQINLVAPCKK